MTRPSLSLILPTWRAACHLRGLLATINAQTRPTAEVVVVDSSSDDATVSIARSAGCRVEIIAKQSFNHGSTRNYGALHTSGEILVFMTQDALPSGEEFFAALVEPIVSGDAAATYARQVPRPGATPPERFQRAFQYPDPAAHAARSGAGVAFKYFCSNAAMAVDRRAFFSVGGFPPMVPCCEDIALSAKLQRSGYRVLYQPSAVVIHSHGLRSAEQFRRYFDIGAAYSLAGKLLASSGPSGDGRRYAMQMLRYLRRDRSSSWISCACAEIGIRWAGYRAGQMHWLFPRVIKRRLSLQPLFWDSFRSGQWQADDPRVLAGARSRQAHVGGAHC